MLLAAAGVQKLEERFEKLLFAGQSRRGGKLFAVVKDIPDLDKKAQDDVLQQGAVQVVVPQFHFGTKHGEVVVEHLRLAWQELHAGVLTDGHVLDGGRRVDRVRGLLEERVRDDEQPPLKVRANLLYLHDMRRHDDNHHIRQYRISRIVDIDFKRTFAQQQHLERIGADKLRRMRKGCVYIRQQQVVLENRAPRQKLF